MSNTTIDNTDDTIDSRDVITRIEELDSDLQDLKDTIDNIDWGDDAEIPALLAAKEALEEWKIGSDGLELEALIQVGYQGEYIDDWDHGVQLIRDSYFKKAMDEMVSECYELPKDLPSWMVITYDYDALKQDYTSVDFDGETYWVR